MHRHPLEKMQLLHSNDSTQTKEKKTTNNCNQSDIQLRIKSTVAALRRNQKSRIHMTAEGKMNLQQENVHDYVQYEMVLSKNKKLIPQRIFSWNEGKKKKNESSCCT